MSELQKSVARHFPSNSKTTLDDLVRADNAFRFRELLGSDDSVDDRKSDKESAIEGLTHIEGLQPVHIIILFILVEKQTQNWLYSRWGLNKTMISKFVQVEFFLGLDKKGGHLLPTSQVNHCHDVFKYDMKEDKPRFHASGEKWSVEDYSNAITSAWRSVKLHCLVKTAINVGIRDLV